MGLTGASGKQGIMGTVGPKGDPGLKGQKGDMGPAGMPGHKGEPGESITAPVVSVSPYTTGDRAEMTRQLGSCTVKKRVLAPVV